MTEDNWFTVPGGLVITSKEQALAELRSVEEQLAPLYRVRQALRDGIAENYPAPELPRPRYRTDKQNAIARCPRCGGRLMDEGAAQE